MKHLNTNLSKKQIYFALVIAVIATFMLHGKASAQQQIGYYPNMDGGLENQAGGNLGTKIDTLKWYYSTNGTASTQVKSVTTTGGYGGPKYVTVGRAAGAVTASTTVSTNEVKTTTFPINTLYVVQFWYKANAQNTMAPINTSYISISPDGTSANRIKKTITLSTPSTWTFFYDTVRTGGTINPTSAGVGGINISSGASATTPGNAVYIDVDNYVIYPADDQAKGGNDVTPPDAVTSASAVATTPADIAVSWSAPTTGIDSGGYIVVRYTTQPTTAENPLQNAVYAVGDTIAGANNGIVVYIGKGTSIDDNYNVTGNTQYYYKIYTADKAFNYSTAASASAKTAAYSYFYYNGTGAVENIASWGSNTDGTGTNPSDFTNSGQYFYLQNATNITVSNPWIVSGSSSKIILGNSNQPAINLTVASTGSLTANMDIVAPSTGIVSLTVNGGTIPSFGIVTGNPNLTVGTNVNTTIPKVNYGNVVINTPPTVIVNIADTLLVNNLTINTGAVLSTTTNKASSLSPITIASGGLVTINGTLETGKTAGLLSTTGTGTLNFLGTTNYTLGPNSTIVYNKVATTTVQTISAANYANLTIAGASPKVFEAAAFKVSGNLVYANTGNASVTPVSPTSIEFNGTGVQNIDSIPAPYYTDITFSGGGLKKLHTSITVSGIVSLVSGKVDVGADTLFLTSAATIGSGTNSSYFVTGNSSTGRVVLLGMGATSTYTVPVGSPNYYLEVNLTPAQNNEMAIAAFDGLTNDGTYGGNPVSSTILDQSINAFWNISSINGSGSVKVGVSWPAAIEGTTFTSLPNNQINLVGYNGINWLPGNYGSANNSSNIASDSFSTFTVFTVTKKGGLLPVSSINLNLTKQSGGVLVKWSTTNEINTSKCIVERSINGLDFKSINSVNSAGTSYKETTYSLIDKTYQLGLNYYRIKLLDKDGHFTYSPISTIEMNDKASFVIVNNPVIDRRINILSNAIQNGQYTVSLYNEAGQKIVSTSLSVNNNIASMNLPVSSILIAGTYYVRISGTEFSQTIPVLVK